MNKGTIIESHIILGYACNHKCKHCVVQVKREQCIGESKNLLFEEAIAAITTAIQNGANKIVFSGGEPTLRSDLAELVLFCLKKNLNVQIQTNGSKVDNIKMICETSKEFLPNIEFMIPLHSSVDEENDYICGCKGALKDARKTLNYLKNMDVRVIGKVVLTRYTGDLNDICSIYEEYGVKQLIIAYPHCVSFPEALVKKIDLIKEEVVEIFESFFSFSHKLDIILQAFPRCFIGKEDAIIQEECEEYLRTRIVEYKFRSYSGGDWHEFRKLDKKKFDYCIKCKHTRYCEGIWKEYMRVFL